MINIFKINPWHLVIGLVIAVCLLLVWNASIRREVAEERSKTSQLERELITTREQVTEKTKVATIVTTKPDGTVITETIKEENKSKVSEKISDKEKVSSEEIAKKTVKQDRQRYSVGAYADWSRNLSASVGAGLGSLPVEAVLLGTDNLKTFSLGVVFRW